LGPADQFKVIAKKVFNIIKSKHRFGPDQVAINYFLHDLGYISLDDTYNFLPVISRKPFMIKSGVFYFKDGEKIAVMHNAVGALISNFGYGRNYNKLNKVKYHTFNLSTLPSRVRKHVSKLKKFVRK
jgi:hypothetical protein